MRVSDSGRLNKKPCRIAANCCRMSRWLQARHLRTRRRMTQVHPERDQCETRRTMPDQNPRSLDWPSVWMPPEGGLTMTALTQVISQYLLGDPMWDGPRTVASMRSMVAD